MSLHSPTRFAVLRDAPAYEPDLLRFTRYVEPLAELITDPKTETPFTVGIFGKWGSGKTTLMQMVEARLQEYFYPTVWFNPWLYQNEHNLVVPLLQTIHDSLQASALGRIRDAAERVATVVAQVSASVFIKTATLGQVSLEDVEKRIAVYNKQRAEGISTIRTLHNQLQRVVDQVTAEGENGRLVLFIDDLDRCGPAKIIGLLEVVKLFLDLKHTILFIAVDRDVVQKGIQIFYKDFLLREEEYAPLTADYMDKMIQLPLHLHPLGVGQVEEYLRQLSLSSDQATQMRIYRQCLHPNPRKIKRVLNIYAMSSAIVDRDPDWEAALSKSLLAKLIIVQQQWPELYGHAVLHPELLSILEQVYHGKLNINRSEDWVFLQSRQQELQKLSTHYYDPTSQLSLLFASGESFQNVDLSHYLFLLG